MVNRIKLAFENLKRSPYDLNCQEQLDSGIVFIFLVIGVVVLSGF